MKPLWSRLFPGSVGWRMASLFVASIACDAGSAPIDEATASGELPDPDPCADVGAPARGELTDALAVLAGPKDSVYAGHAVAIHHGPGCAAGQLVIGTPWGSGGAGAVWTVDAEDRTLSLDDAEIVGDTGAELGTAVSADGDLDGDGEDDMVAGAPCDGGHEETETECSDTGDGGDCWDTTVWVCGPGAVVAASGTLIRGDEAGEGVGLAFATGDFNDDGTDDLAVLAAGDYQHSAEVGVFFGPVTGERAWTEADAVLSGIASAVGMGPQANLLSFVDDDGASALAVGAPWDRECPDGCTWAGLAWVMAAPLTGTLDEANAAFTAKALEGGADSDTLLGAAVAAGDFDGDGHMDLAVGAPWAEPERCCVPGPGAVAVFLGPLDGVREYGAADALLVGNEYLSEAGMALTTAWGATADHDGLTIGAPGEADFAGTAYLMLDLPSGRTTLAEIPRRWQGPDANDVLGSAFAWGDVTGDALPDLVVAAPHNNTGPGDGGTVYVFGGE